ncbi:MAG TPA: hypothetical protein VH413_01440 [Verrucomicrobiae bacterium]|nr:hypothetical protein [Verrucomicrobiae bacterium]
MLLSLGGVEASQPLDTSSPLNFFTGTANLFLQNAGYNFTVTNIPIYPINFYTPAVHRLLQLAANLYDSTTNRAFSDGMSPNGPFYPSVFRPTFNRSGNNIFISGYVEEGDGTLSYNAIPLTLPDDLALVSSTTTNIYGIPWVIGARKGFPNFNEISMACIAQVTRRVEVVNLNFGGTPPMFQTNVQYIVGISNTIGVEAWNSYSNFYPRAVDLLGACDLSMSVSNDSVLLASSNRTGVNGLDWRYTIESNAWAGAAISPNSPHLFNTNSFQVPMLTNTIFLPDMVYHTTPIPHFGTATNFDLSVTMPAPNFILNATNTLRFIMLDHITGRVIDYVQLGGMNFTRNLTSELPGTDGGGDGGVWLTNLNRGILNQISISEGVNVANFLSPADWIADSLPGNSQMNAIAAFAAFINGQGGLTNALITPFTPTRKIVSTYVWQANDPLVHYMLSDLTPSPIQLHLTTNYVLVGSLPALTNFLSNVGNPNPLYRPWDDIGTPNGTRTDPLTTYAFSPAIKDPLVLNSDSWNFPTNLPLTLQSIANVHRGTPWQTVYLKSTSVPLNIWESWTGDTNDADAVLSEPTNDWGIVACLLPYLAPQRDPHFTYGFNQSLVSAWSPAFQGLTVFTNTGSAQMPLVIDAITNSAAIAQIVSGINAQRALEPGGLFTNAISLLAVPQLTVASPFINTSNPMLGPGDSAYEALPAQLLPLLRPDAIGSLVSTNGTTQIQFTGMNGYAYIVQGSENLQDWFPLATNFPNNGSFVFSEAGVFPRRYYRTVLAP